MISLIIKGYEMPAMLAAARHGVEINVIRVLPKWPETVATCDSKFREQVGKWFCQAPVEAPYPTGTLLWYGEKP